MKILLALLVLLGSLASGWAATTIDANNAYAYSANAGWMNAYADCTNGAVLGQWYCTGYIYSANVGWICLGNGPTNGCAYSNTSGNDWGVNNIGGGQLSGLAYGANIGWIEFEQTYGMPQVNLLNGQLSGCAYSANCGWISLSNTVAVLQTDSLSPGPLDGNGSGLPIAWEMQYCGGTNINPNADPTGKGMSILQDYLAGTDPNNSNSVLRLTSLKANPQGTVATSTWTSVSSRFYYIVERTNLLAGAWTTNALGMVCPDAGPTTTRALTDSAASSRYFRVQAVIPLSP